MSEQKQNRYQLSNSIDISDSDKHIQFYDNIIEKLKVNTNAKKKPELYMQKHIKVQEFAEVSDY